MVPQQNPRLHTVATCGAGEAVKKKDTFRLTFSSFGDAAKYSSSAASWPGGFPQHKLAGKKDSLRFCFDEVFDFTFSSTPNHRRVNDHTAVVDS